MIAIDTYLLVYAHRSDTEWHARAAEIVRELAEGAAAWAVPWPSVHEFLAVVTHPRIFRTPTPMRAALAQVDAWRESPSLVMLAEDADYWDTLTSLLLGARITGPRVHDARVAALSVGHAVRELWTADRDFSLFPTLPVRNPLVG